jgi:C-terminal processing protease CtpA/Prc
MTWPLTRGACDEELSFEIRRGTQELTVLERRAEYDEMDFGRYFQHDRPGEAFQKLSDSISYLKLSAVSVKDIPAYLERAGAGDLIIDLRGYPAEFVVYALGGHLVSAPTPFAQFTWADLSNPGAFGWSRPYSLDPVEPHFGGKVVLLVDETTQSLAEYTAMAFRAAPSATVVGSTTAGADGDDSSIVLPGGVTGGISGIGVFYPDQRQTQRVGIVPDVWARPTVEGVRGGRDEVLEAGIRIILHGRASDAEIRRMALRR